ncbi:MAG: branched-chain amino acid ABC transporter permease [Desulforhabdus sp.]|jgi:branched-chain amino acid transport system permease protein|nr:branched-chain amino acid ABC transporter permease [Desulforhabdus sp.]
MPYLPCGVYHERYKKDHAWWQTTFVRAKMLTLAVGVLVVFPLLADSYLLGVANMIGYTFLGALGVQLLIGFCGQVTLGHTAFIAVGAYTSTLLILQVPWPQLLIHNGLVYPLSVVIASLVAGLWSVLFGLPSAKVKGFYLILTTMAAQFITVDFIITQYVSQIGGRGQAFSLPPGTIKVGPWTIDNDRKVYFLMVGLVVLSTVAVANLLRTRTGRAWIAIRDNDVAAETMGINIVKYKLFAFLVAGFIGGLAGAFWVSNLAAISPEHFTWSWSLWLVGVILIGGVGSIHGTFFGSIFMVVVMEALTLGVMSLADIYPELLLKLNFVKEAAFGLAICGFLIYEPKGLAYRWWQIKNYFNLWPFSY